MEGRSESRERISLLDIAPYFNDLLIEGESFMRIRLVLLYVLTSFFLIYSSISTCNAASVEFSAPEKTGLGEPFLVTFESKAELSGLEISWQERTFYPEVITRGEDYQAFLILGTDTKDVIPGIHLLKVRGQSVEEDVNFSWQIRVLEKTYPVEYLNVEVSMVTPPREVLSRIKREKIEIEQVLDTDTSIRYWELPFSRPLEGDFTSTYGKRRFFNGLSKSRHGGVDIRAASGTAVKAVSDGTVILTGDHYFAGKSIYIDHGNGLVSMYFHLSRIDVVPGQRVRKGDRLALSGCTGRVTGPHLHFGVSVKGEMIDPVPLFNMDVESFIFRNRAMIFKP